MIEAPVFQRAPGGAGLAKAADEARAKLNAEGPRFSSAARAANHARGAGLANLAGGQSQATVCLREFRAYDTHQEATTAARTQEGTTLKDKLDRTTPTHPGTAGGPPPGDFLVDRAANEARGVPGQAGNRAGSAPRPERVEEGPMKI